MNVRQSDLLYNLRIWQQNVHKSKTAQAYILNTANPKDWDVIALQEPWFDSFGNTRGTQYWRVVYPSNFYVEGWARVRSILLINTNISTDCYSIPPIMHSDVTAACFKGDNGYLSLFNVYNEITNNDTITCLDSFLTCNAHLIRPSPLDCVLWLGSPFCDLAHLEPASQADNSPCQSSHPTLANEQIVAIGNRMAKMKPVPILNQLANVLVRIDQLSAY